MAYASGTKRRFLVAFTSDAKLLRSLGLLSETLTPLAGKSYFDSWLTFRTFALLPRTKLRRGVSAAHLSASWGG